MTTDEFLGTYWSQYILLEKEFSETIHFVELATENKNTFSHAYQKLMLEIGSEIDIVFKQYCDMLDEGFKGKSIGKYKECIKNQHSAFINQKVNIIINEQIIVPWSDWNINKLDAPYWWTAYNKIKHSRTSVGEINGVKQKYYKFANQEYTIFALAGLFQILINIYFKLAQDENGRIKTPLPGSRLFKMIGDEWDNVNFFGDFAFFVDEGCLIYETSTLHY